MIDITTSQIGHTFSYTELIDATEAVWGAIAWPGPEKPGCVVVVGAGKVRYVDGYVVSILDEYHSFDVRELVKQCVAMDLKYWISRNRVDQSGSPAGRWIADETHDAAEKFLAESKYGMQERQPGLPGYTIKPSTLQLTRTVLIEMHQLYDYLMPKIEGWRRESHRLLHLKSGSVAISLNEFGPEDVERKEEPKVGTCPAVEALGYAVIEMQEWLERRFRGRVYQGSSQADRGATNLFGI